MSESVILKQVPIQFQQMLKIEVSTYPSQRVVQKQIPVQAILSKSVSSRVAEELRRSDILWKKWFFDINIKFCSIHVCSLLKSKWKWSIYPASLEEYKVQLEPFAMNTIKKRKWPVSLRDQVLPTTFFSPFLISSHVPYLLGNNGKFRINMLLVKWKEN